MSLDLAHLRALLAAATPGPWLGPRITDAWPPGCLGLYALDDHGEPAEIIGLTGYAADDSRADHDAALVAAAVNALPDLLAEIEQLRSLIRQTPTMLAMQIAESACPCHHTTPCHDRCTCINSFSSSGCRRCATYGSAEQQKAAAKRLVRQEAIAEVTREWRDEHGDDVRLAAAVDTARKETP